MSERALHLIGWAFFLASAVFYTLSSWRSGDWQGLLGSLLFFVACLFFVGPLLTRRRDE